MPAPNPRGVYLQVAEALKGRIEAGVIDGQVPSEAAIGAEFGIARTTVRRALAVLEAEGLIETLPGRTRRVASEASTAAPYEQIRADLAAQIEYGRLQAGERMPPENELAARYGVSRGTVQRALGALEAAGRVEARQGVGRIVFGPPAGG